MKQHMFTISGNHLRVTKAKKLKLTTKKLHKLHPFVSCGV